jgi:hypothetical protein
VSWIQRTLTLLLPEPEDTALLEACLATGERAHAGWARYTALAARCGAPLDQQLAAARRLLPCLAESAARNQLAVPATGKAVLNAAVFREELRATRFQRIAGEALDLLCGDAVPVLVTRGTALAATVYPRWSLRHCHDLELLLPDRALAQAMRSLVAAGWRPSPQGNGAGGARLRHPSGMEAALHTAPFPVRFFGGSVEDFSHDASEITVAGVTARAPRPEMTLVHVLGHASCDAGGRRSWVMDVWYLLTSCPDIGWPSIVERLTAYRLALPTAALLRYVSELGARVPGAALMDLARTADEASRADMDGAIAGVVRATSGDLGRLWKAQPSLQGRLGLARWALAPSAGYLRRAFTPAGDWMLPLFYLWRPARFMTAALARRVSPDSGVGQPELRPTETG